jgi:hypothetical protein
MDEVVNALRRHAERPSRYWLSAIGFRKSSSRISPGCTGGSRSSPGPALCAVVVDDLDLIGISIAPSPCDAYHAPRGKESPLTPAAGRSRF